MDSPVTRHSNLRSLPLTSSGQRNFFPNHDGCPSELESNFQVGNKGSERSVEAAADNRHFTSQSAREESEEEQAFPATFFANPFAVSFPGDIPCPGAPLFDTVKSDATAGEHAMLCQTGGGSGCVDLAATPGDCIDQYMAPPSSQNPSIHLPLGSPSVRTPPAHPSASHPPEIQFVDMADKKGAQRLRNTINSRKHRQSKLQRIRELEEKLVACEGEREEWKARAVRLGWTG